MKYSGNFFVRRLRKESPGDSLFCSELIFCAEKIFRPRRNFRADFYFRVRLQNFRLRTDSRRNCRERELKKLVERHKNFPEFVEKSGELLAEEEIFLPTEPESEKFAAEIYRVAELNKVEVSSLRAGEVSKVEPKEKNSDDKGELFFQPVKVELSGNYVAILNFIREISDGERFTQLSGISITSNEEENFLKCEAEFLIYNRNLREEKS